MALTIVVQNIVHSEIGRYSDDPAGTLQRLCSARPETSLLRRVDPHADTMFNAYQLDRIIAEIDALTAESAQHAKEWTRLRDAAMTAIRNQGYLWFSGD
ncbi:hypothetical protein [Nocardia asteroides]|uniref:hypothetical protein n=1 Tax=Nocardia asteroides TaxID=1824 RepID=UPI001E52D672|nr:hypothetical protein [Nocardia asteroides]UGT62249.1 hypothetical protein LTT61_02560 [Nocardia asteroides]